ncbi:MAG: hypothetical protein LBK72_02195 [Bifidobacteriaceae bacterium]|jgi:site-specific recombinase XerC|nr:hypothetical protein [Bifidobacteriaceae bacterium]
MECDYCHRSVPVGEQNACRLCLEQARMLQEPGRSLDLKESNRHGQQMFLANMHQHRRRRTKRLGPVPRAISKWQKTQFEPANWDQPALFNADADPEAVRRASFAEESELTRHCTPIIVEHAAKYGWSVRQRNDVYRSLRLLQTLRDTPTAKIRASDVMVLPKYDGNILSTLDVLQEAGLLIEDRPSHIERYFAGKTATLPEPMRRQLETWLDVMVNGSTTAPRQRSRDPLTARLKIMGAAPVLLDWAQAGRQSLAEITQADVLAALPEAGPARYAADAGLRSIFKILKDRKLVFANPMRKIRAAQPNQNVPLPLDPRDIQAALDSPDPATAAAVAMVAFHAVTAKQLAEMMLSDIADGRLRIGERDIPLAEPVRVRLAAWLDHRARKWPNSLNPHLFVSTRTGPRLAPVGRQFPWSKTNLRPQALREDRIVAEIIATEGDVRQICELFGLTIESAARYLRVLDPPAPDTRDRTA